jgi:hypothetical protein
MKRAKSRWNAHFLTLEFSAGVAVTLGLVIWGESVGMGRLNCFLSAHRETLYAVVAPINAALLGFIVAAAAIIVTAAPSNRMEQLRESAHYGDLWATFRSAMRFLGAATIATILGLVLTWDGRGGRMVFYVVVGLTVLAALRVARCVWAVNWVVRIFTGPPPGRPAGG